MTNFYDDELIPSQENDETSEDDSQDLDGNYRASTSDPAFGFLLALAVSIGLIPILPEYADLRYTLAWGALTGVGVIAWLLGNADRITQEEPENIAWGVGFGAMVSVPFLLFFFGTFGDATALMFPASIADGELVNTHAGIGTILAYLVFVMPVAETLFFRGLLQKRLDFYIIGALSGIWSVVLFFPVMWGEITNAPAVGVFLAVALFSINMMYAYVNNRNGLAASWICQIVASLILFFVPVLAV